MFRRALLVVTIGIALLGCRDKSRVAPPDAAAPPPSAAPSPAKRARRGNMDVTFLVVSDTHVGYQYPDDWSKIPGDPVKRPSGLEVDDLALIAKVNAIEGKPYPPRFGGTVAKPRGLAITGDLTEWGRKHEWEHFVALFGLTGKESPLRIPVFEMVGNHDRNDNGPWVSDQVAARHGGRFYSWDWDDLHLVALGEAPDEYGIEFLKRDLALIEPDVPVVIFFHLALLGPWSTENWFADGGFKAKLRTALEGHVVAAVFHGHHHATGHYLWEGIDVWKPGAVKDGAHTFAVVHVTDARFDLASYDWDKDAWDETYMKSLPAANARGAR